MNKQEMLKELDNPVFINGVNFLKKGKLKIIIINEDSSASTKFLKFPNSYTIEVKNKSYFVLPKCIIKADFPTLIYFYNNPMPIFLEFQRSKITALDLRQKDKRERLSHAEITMLNNIPIDAEAVNLAFTTRALRGLYWSSKMTAKTVIIILVVVTIIVLVFLQIFGIVDVLGAINGFAKGVN